MVVPQEGETCQEGLTFRWSRSPGWRVTRPGDLPEGAVADALEQLWGFRPRRCCISRRAWQPPLARRRRGRRLFATVGDLAARLRPARDTGCAAFGRLAAAFATARALRADAGLSFVIARAGGGRAGRGPALGPVLPHAVRVLVAAGRSAVGKTATWSA